MRLGPCRSTSQPHTKLITIAIPYAFKWTTNALVSGEAPALRAMAAKTRYRQADAACELQHARQDSFHLQFTEAQWAVTPGQSAVMYVGEVCLGGGVIASTHSPKP